jgi:tryptophan-rich sensory protein
MFFAARNRRAAIAVIAALDVAIAAEITGAARHDRTAAALLGPYLAWSLYATALTAAIDPENRADE